MKNIAIISALVGSLMVSGCVGGSPAPKAPTVVATTAARPAATTPAASAPTAARPAATTAAPATTPAASAPTAARPAATTAAPATTPAAAAPSAGDAAKGKELVTAKGCIACHTIQGVPGAAGTIGPELTKIAGKATFVPGVNLAFNDENLKKWLTNPPAVKPGTAMPNLALSAVEIDNLIAYIKTLK
ncbi:MAG: Cytochrome c oxidase, subunit [Dehalococcoidia bacterium]|nr:Cytochrome c oxidase, subunit [Dehalococcoidia bacterium]